MIASSSSPPTPPGEPRVPAKGLQGLGFRGWVFVEEARIPRICCSSKAFYQSTYGTAFPRS